MYKLATKFFAAMTLFSVVGLILTHLLKKGVVLSHKGKNNQEVVLAGNKRLLKRTFFKMASWVAPLWMVTRIKSALSLQKKVKKRRRFYLGAALLLALGLKRRKKIKHT